MARIFGEHQDRYRGNITGTNRVTVITTAASETVYVDLRGFWSRNQVNMGMFFETAPGSACVVSGTTSSFDVASLPAQAADVTWQSIATLASAATASNAATFPSTLRFVFSTPAGSKATFAIN